MPSQSGQKTKAFAEKNFIPSKNYWKIGGKEGGTFEESIEKHFITPDHTESEPATSGRFHKKIKF